MKKFLLGATASAALLSAGSALAQGAPPTTITTNNFNARIGGFMTLGIGYVDSDLHKAEVELVNDSEVHFVFTLAADNGLTFGAKAEIENNGGPTTSDEYVGWVEGTFGRFEVGAEDGAHDRLVGAAAGGTAFTAVADETGFLFDYAGGESPAVPVVQGNDSGDDLKVTYFTPKFAGFQAGVSYANSAEGSTSTNGAVGSRESYEIGANYSNTFGGVSLEVAGGYTSYSDPQDARFGGKAGDDSYTLLANIGFAGFTVGGSWGVSSFETGDDDEGYGVGVNYATGPWLFGVQYAQMVGGDAEDDYGISAGADYALAPGVTTGVTLEYADGDAAGTLAEEDDAFAAGVWMAFGF